MSHAAVPAILPALSPRTTSRTFPSTDTTEFFDEQTLLEMVDNQLADGHPLQVKATLMRLVMKGTPRDEALQYIACALGAELMAMEADQGPFNLTRYAEFLDSLPEMPWAE